MVVYLQSRSWEDREKYFNKKLAWKEAALCEFVVEEMERNMCHSNISVYFLYMVRK